jgi:DNA primase
MAVGGDLAQLLMGAVAQSDPKKFARTLPNGRILVGYPRNPRGATAAILFAVCTRQEVPVGVPNILPTSRRAGVRAAG